MPNDNPAKTAWVRKALAFVAILVVIAGVAGVVMARQKSPAPTPASQTTGNSIKVGDQSFETEIADTPEKQRQGLSGRQSLGENAAMLFPYEHTDIQCFWMKDMNFPLDMIWLNADKTINTIHADVQPESYPNETFCPDTPAQYVVEFVAGTAEKHGWQKGTQFSF